MGWSRYTAGLCTHLAADPVGVLRGRAAGTGYVNRRGVAATHAARVHAGRRGAAGGVAVQGCPRGAAGAVCGHDSRRAARQLGVHHAAVAVGGHLRTAAMGNGRVAKCAQPTSLHEHMHVTLLSLRHIKGACGSAAGPAMQPPCLLLCLSTLPIPKSSPRTWQ